MARLVFVSDLHLHPGGSARTDLFLRLVSELQEHQTQGAHQHLFAVGDLFSFWVDREIVARLFEPVLDALARFTASGARLTLLEGNRDFGFGTVMARRCGPLLPGECADFKQGETLGLALHGDQLLTADRRYQIFKRMVRSLPARLLARALPSPLLLWMVRRLEGVSETEKARKSPRDMRVDRAAAAAAAARAGASVQIHGHTHEPGYSEIEQDGRSVRVFNLGEWSDKGGRILVWPEDSEPQLADWPPRERDTARSTE